MSKHKRNTKAGEQGPSWRVRAEEVSLLGRELAEKTGGVASVACPECHSQGPSCVRPSGHKASDYHRGRKDAFDLMVWESYVSRFQALTERWRSAGWVAEGPQDLICPVCCAPPTMECIDAIPSEPCATHEHLGLHVARVGAWMELTETDQETSAPEPKALPEDQEAGPLQGEKRSLFKAKCDCGYQSMPGPSSGRAASCAKRHKCWQTCRVIEYDPATGAELSSHVVVTGTPGQEPKKRTVSTAPKPEAAPVAPALARVEPQRTLEAWGVFG